MSSSYNNTISSSSTQSFLPAGALAGANNFNREEMVMTMIQQPNSVALPPPPPRQLRNKPGNPNADAEVIALSPKTIMATNQFLCEVCNKGFPREQNLQLHRRAHNLACNLKQNPNKEVRRKVYLCPDPSCPNHDLSRALGDLTGIKKHYFRKHCEKIFSCLKCSKGYALQSDLKAHSKICGTKKYQCECGTRFSRRDSYLKHKAFCGALVHESPRNLPVSFTAMTAVAGGGGGRHFSYGGDASVVSHDLFSNCSNTGFTPLAAGYNLNHSASRNFQNFVSQPTNPNLDPTNFLMKCPSNQGLLAHNDQSLMNQHGLISLTNNINNDNNNNNLFNLRYFQDNTNNSYKTSVPYLFADGANKNDPSALLRGSTSSSLSSFLVSDFGDNENGNLQGLENTLAATYQQGRIGSSIYNLHSGNNLSMGGSHRLTFDFLGVNGGNVSNVNGRGGGNPAPLDVEMKFSYPNGPNNPFG